MGDGFPDGLRAAEFEVMGVALQVWQQYRQDPDAALSRYRRALALGGTRPLPELWAEAGLTFEFSAETAARLVEMVRRELRGAPL